MYRHINIDIDRYVYVHRRKYIAISILKYIYI